MKKKILCTLLTSVLAFGCPISASAAEITATAVPNSSNLVGWSDFSDGMCLVAQNYSKFGYINTAGKVVISPKYNYAGDFSEGKAMVVIDGKVCYIDKTGKVVISTGLTYDYDAYSWAYGGETEFKNGLACAYGPGGWGTINTSGRVVIPFRFDNPYFFNDKGMAQIFLNGDMNYIDTKGNLIFPTGYRSLSQQKDGTWIGHKDPLHEGFFHSEYGSADLLDAKGNVIRSNISTSNGEYDLIDLAQSTLDEYGLSKDRYFSISTPSEGIALATLQYDLANAKYDGASNIYIDTETCREIAGPFYLAEDFQEGYALAARKYSPDGLGTTFKYGLINTKGQTVLPFEYETMHTTGFAEGHMLARKNNTLYIIKSTGHKGGFTDVSSADYFYKPVKWAVDEKITSGVSDTSFAPNQTCTRGQIISFLWRAAGSPQPSISNPYSDVKNSDYFYSAALWAYEQGMAEGTSFAPNAPCTRAMAVEFMWAYDGSPSYAAELPFYDVNADADYAEAVAWAVDAGVTSGTSETTFSPDSTCTRGQIVTFLYRGFAK